MENKNIAIIKKTLNLIKILHIFTEEIAEILDERQDPLNII